MQRGPLTGGMARKSSGVAWRRRMWRAGGGGSGGKPPRAIGAAGGININKAGIVACGGGGDGEEHIFPTGEGVA